MQTSIWQTIANTPWWVFLIAVYVLIVGYTATKPRIIPIKQLLIFPAIFFALSIFSMYTLIPVSIKHIALWLGMMLIGGYAGWLQFKAMKIKAIKEAKQLHLPGTWSLMVIVLVLFGVRYYFGYELSLNPEMMNDPKVGNILLSIYGLVTGLFIGRLIYALRILKNGPFLQE